MEMKYKQVVSSELYNKSVSQSQCKGYIHALNVVKKFVAPDNKLSRKIITGVYHDEQNRMIATDNMKVIRISDIWKEDFNNFTVNKKNEILEESFPETNKFFPNVHDSILHFNLSTDKYIIKLLKGLTVFLKSCTSEVVTLTIKDNVINVKPMHKIYEIDLNLSLNIPIDIQKIKNNKEIEINLNLDFLVNTLESFSKMKCKSVNVYFSNEKAPVYFSDDSRKVEIIIMPVRKY